MKWRITIVLFYSKLDVGNSIQTCKVVYSTKGTSTRGYILLKHLYFFLFVIAYEWSRAARLTVKRSQFKFQIQLSISLWQMRSHWWKNQICVCAAADPESCCVYMKQLRLSFNKDVVFSTSLYIMVTVIMSDSLNHSF